MINEGGKAMLVEQEVAAPDEVLTPRERRARVLEDAALEIEVRGWGVGSKSAHWQNGGPVCLMGGILAAESCPPVISPDRGLVPNYSRAGRVWGGNPLALMVWNDFMARGADDAALVLRWRADEVRKGQ